MRKLLIVAAVLTAVTLSAQAPSPELTVVNAAAQALGGKDKLLAVKTLRIVGYGQNAYQDGGGNITGSPDAPQKWINVSQDRVIDFAGRRMRLEQRQTQDFVFAYERNMRGQRGVQGLDGDVAFNVLGDGRAVRANAAAVRARRLEMLNNPLSLIRAALEPAAKLSNLRKTGPVQTLDMVTPTGEQVTFAVDATTNLPAWVSWVQPNQNLGDLRLRTHFTGYQAYGGILLPSGYNTVSDFRNVVQQKIYIDNNFIDAPAISLAAPDAVRTAAVPPDAPPVNVEVVPVAKGIWYLKGQGNTTAFEFSDHITLFEAYGSEANAKAIIDKARTLVPGKPVTQVIVSHHHFDHSGGLRTAVAEGLEIITHRGNTGIFQEMTSRPATLFPDALGRTPKPLKLLPVDEKLVLKDAMMEVHVLHAINNSHMANAVLAYVPGERIVAQGDLVDQGWDIVWWGNSYPESVKFYNLQVEKDLAVHGDINTYEVALNHLRKQAATAKAFCDKADRENYAVAGCPATNVGF
jgi:hypothetical protein